MIHTAVVAIVLAVLVMVLVTICRKAFKRWKYPPKPRRRDFTPAHIQQRLLFRATLKRTWRGLRFPTVAQMQAHKKFLKWYERLQGKGKVHMPLTRELARVLYRVTAA